MSSSSRFFRWALRTLNSHSNALLRYWKVSLSRLLSRTSSASPPMDSKWIRCTIFISQMIVQNLLLLMRSQNAGRPSTRGGSHTRVIIGRCQMRDHRLFRSSQQMNHWCLWTALMSVRNSSLPPARDMPRTSTVIEAPARKMRLASPIDFPLTTSEEGAQQMRTTSWTKTTRRWLSKLLLNNRTATLQTGGLISSN